MTSGNFFLPSSVSMEMIIIPTLESLSRLFDEFKILKTNCVCVSVYVFKFPINSSHGGSNDDLTYPSFQGYVKILRS